MSFLRLLIWILVLPVGVITAHAHGTPTGAALEHELTLTLDPGTHRLGGESTISVAAIGGARQVLQLNPQATVETVSFNDSPIPYTFVAGKLTLHIPSTPVGHTGRITIRYSCIFNDQLPERFLNSDEPTYGINGIVTPQGTFLSPEAGWYPQMAIPPARFIVTVVAPSGTEAITAGKRLRRETVGGSSVSTWEIRDPLPGLSLSAGPYRIRERVADGIPIYTYFYRDDEALAGDYLAAAAKYLRSYRKLFGPYPFAKFAVVENFFPTGYGFPSYTLIGGSVLRLPFIIDTSLPHEIAHNWWGNGALVSDVDGNWSEGLVTYLADYRQEAQGVKKRAADYRYRLLVEYASVVTPDRDFPLRQFRSRVDPVSHAIGYGKGAMLFQMVHARIGDRAFYAGLKRVLAEKLFKTASWSDFARAFSAESGKDMVAFMTPWLDRAGGPRLSLQGVTRSHQGGKWLIQGVVVQQGLPYRLTLTLRTETAAGNRDTDIEVAGEQTPFTLTVVSAPKRLVLDPDHRVFRVLDRREIPMSVNRIKGAKSLLVIVTKGCRADEEALRQLLLSLGRQDAAIYREGGPEPDKLADHDLLYCGMPTTAGALPPLPTGVGFSAGSFTIGTELFKKAGDALFVVLGDPGGSDRAVALFLPLSADAAARSVPKISHYGKFGYLVFTDGKNRAKGYFPPARSVEVQKF